MFRIHVIPVSDHHTEWTFDSLVTSNRRRVRCIISAHGRSTSQPATPPPPHHQAVRCASSPRLAPLDHRTGHDGKRCACQLPATTMALRLWYIKSPPPHSSHGAKQNLKMADV
jgi:hypothetical protein